MRANANIFWILTVFLGLAAVLYTVWSMYFPTQPTDTPYQGIEWVGSIGILLTAVLSALIAFYVGRVYKAQGGELPEDRLDANIDDGEAEQGFFAPWSWWPVMIAISAALIFTGIAVGVWIAFIGGALVLVSIVGWQYEFYRGYHAH